MEYLIAFGIWLGLGGLISFALNMLGIGNRPCSGLSPKFIIFSFVRLYAILLLVKYATGFDFPGIEYTAICGADIAFCVLTVMGCAGKYGTEHPVTRIKIGQSVGSILFLVYYLIRF